MRKKIVYNLLLGVCLLVISVTLQAQVTLKHWTVEDHSAKMRIEVAGDTLDITAPKGFTMWYNHRLTGDYEISYRVKMLMQGGKNDRLSDLNCFWGANDPEHPGNYMHARMAKRYFSELQVFGFILRRIWR